MSAANRARGARAEVAVVNYLRVNGSGPEGPRPRRMVGLNASEPGAVGAAPARGQHLVGGAVMAQRTPSERFWSKVDKSDPEGCWLWTAGTGGGGYGRFGAQGRRYYAHRYSYEMNVGPIPDGLVIDHLCCVPACVNPAHLEAVSSQENTRRGSIADVTRERHAETTHCPQGHPYDEANTYRTKSRSGRCCRACQRRRMNKTTDAHLCRSCAKRHVGKRYPSGELAEPVDGTAHRLYGGAPLCSMPVAPRTDWTEA